MLSVSLRSFGKAADMLYLTIKALHIIFVVAWMAGLLIFPRYKLHQIKSP